MYLLFVSQYNTEMISVCVSLLFGHFKHSLTMLW